MRYLVRLVTPKGGTVLDPFMGSGSTGCAAVLEGDSFVGIDITPEYVEIARRRIAHHGAQPTLEPMTLQNALDMA
jgi:site-specific DNA-methyltransferase (adenine-specific)